MSALSRGWALAGQSCEVLQRDRSPVIFPILSTVFAIAAAVMIGAPAFISRGALIAQSVTATDWFSPAIYQNDPVLYIAGAAVACVSTFIAIFFNVALASCAVRSMRGEHTKVGEEINAAAQRIGPILGWTLVNTTVGLILAAFENRSPQVGKIVARLAGAAWAGRPL